MSVFLYTLFFPNIYTVHRGREMSRDISLVR